jgi:hypothetical protein
MTTTGIDSEDIKDSPDVDYLIYFDGFSGIMSGQQIWAMVRTSMDLSFSDILAFELT